MKTDTQASLVCNIKLANWECNVYFISLKNKKKKLEMNNKLIEIMLNEFSSYRR